MRIVCLMMVAATASLAWSMNAVAQDDEGWRSLPLIDNGRVAPGWVQVGYGRMIVDDGALKTECSEQGLGLLLYEKQKFGNCQIRVVFRAKDQRSNAGLFIRIDDGIRDRIDEKHPPAKRDAEGNLSEESLKSFQEASEKGIGPWYAVHHGYEVQICDAAAPFSRTGAIYSLAKSADPPKTEPGQWRTMVVTLAGDLVKVAIDGKEVTSFDPAGKDVPQERKWYEPKREPQRPQSGYIGLQTHDPGDVVWFKEVSIRPLNK